MFINIENSVFFPDNVAACLYIDLPKDVFDRLCVSLEKQPDNCYLFFYLDAARYEISAKNNYLNGIIFNVDLHLESNRFKSAVGLSPVDNRFQLIVNDAVLTRGWSLRYRIGAELATSLNVPSVSRTSNAEEVLSEVMDGLRVAFHPTMWEPNDEIPNNVFRHAPEEFKKAISELPVGQAKTLNDSYDRVWAHVSILHVIQAGEDQSQLAKYHLLPNLEDIESLASTYCKHPELISPLMEWALVDAMLYVETIGFARALGSDNRIVGHQYMAPLKPVGFRKQVKGFLSQAAAWGFGEGFCLGYTCIAAGLANALSGSGFWLLFWGITALRWVRQKKDPALDLLNKNSQLLSDMASAHEKLKTYDFNAGLLRSQLYSLELRGAVFSIEVYNILDKRLTRDFGGMANKSF